MKRVKGLFRLIRFELPFSAGICVIMGQLLALGEFAPPSLLLPSFFSVFLISASILVMNDYFDIETDKINAPGRPIPSDQVSPLGALNFAILLLLIGLFLSSTMSLTIFLIAVVLLTIGFLYNRFFKKSGLLGNLMVSFSVGMTFFYGGASVGALFAKEVIFFGVIAALIDLGEEVAADAMDAEGDKLINSNSIAIKYSRLTALKTSSYIFSLVIILSIIPFLLNWFEMIYIIPIGIMDLSIGTSAFLLLKADNSSGRKLIRRIYLGATFGLIVFILMKLFITD